MKQDAETVAICKLKEKNSESWNLALQLSRRSDKSGRFWSQADTPCTHCVSSGKQIKQPEVTFLLSYKREITMELALQCYKNVRIQWM